jgi:hypothetical protein
MKPNQREPEAGEPNYQPNPQEVAALERYLQAAAEKAPRMKVLDGEGAPTVSPDHPDEVIGQVLLMEALGTADHDFFGGMLRQLGDASSQGGKADERGLNFMLSVVKGVKPRDQVEAMLAAQMAAVHVATLATARRLARVDTVPQQDSAERAFNKLARTFAVQMEALKRYRTGGEQNVTVQHVSVSQGGQAIVGNVTQAAREAARETAPDKAAHPPPALADARQAPMTIIGEPERAPVALRRRRNDGGRSPA